MVNPTPEELAYTFWSIHPRDVPDPVGMPDGFRGGFRAWFYAQEIRRLMYQADYLIWSNQHRAWWKANSMGYAVDIIHAGIYSHAATMDICTGANIAYSGKKPPDELPVRIADLPAPIAARFKTREDQQDG